ncbi:unnamed protein product [Peniophora sp. CBMAI 1063]|nr:unnamed protein product [Peniophora sp. CBMAI 1063]
MLYSMLSLAPSAVVEFEDILLADERLRAALVSGSPDDLLDASSYIERSRQVLVDVDSKRRNYLLARWRAAINLRLPIASLPPEILGVIFELDMRNGPITHRRPIVVNYTWLRLGQVCRSWRVLLFGMPNIWAQNIFKFEPERALTLLPLARQACLHLDLWSTEAKKDEIATLLSLVPRSSRIEYTERHGKQDVNMLPDLVSIGVPLALVNLHLSAMRPRSIDARSPLVEHDGLRALNLHNVYIRPPFSSGLRSLSLSMSRVAITRLTLSDLLEILSRNQHLCSLLLHRAFSSTGLVNPDRKITLLTLVSLSLSHDEHACSRMLQHLLLPALEQATIHHASTPATDVTHDLRILLSSLLQAWIGPLGDTTSRLLTVNFIQPPGSGGNHPLALEQSDISVMVSEAEQTIGAEPNITRGRRDQRVAEFRFHLL